MSILFMNSVHVFGQELNFNRDSALKIMPTQPLVQKAETLLYLAESYFLVKNDSTLFYANKAYELVQYSQEFELLTKITILIAQSYEFIDPVLSTEYTLIALENAEKSQVSDLIVYTHNLKGNRHRANMELEEAMEEYQFSLSIHEQESDSMGIARAYNNIGIVHMMSGKYEIGIEYWLQSLGVKMRNGDLISAAITMGNIALYYKDIGKFDEAEDFLLDALEINKHYKDYESVAFNYLIIAQMRQKQNQMTAAITAFEQSIDYCDSVGSYFNKEEALIGLAEVHSDRGDFKKAYQYQTDYTVLVKELYNENNARITRELTTQFETEKKEKELEMLQEVNDAQEKTIEKEKANIALKEERNRYLIIGLVLTGLLVLAVFFVLFKVRKAKKEVEIQKDLVIEKNKEITDSINYAKRLQDALLPTTESLRIALSNHFVLYLPKDIVAGDFYWMEQTDNADYIAVADCTGHGVPGAMVSVVCCNALNKAVRELEIRDTGEILDKVTDIVVETFEKSGHEVKDGMDIALCRIDKKKEKIQFSGANNPLYILNGKELIEYKGTKQPVGNYSDRRPFETHEIVVEKNSKFYLFTDGYADQFGGEKGKKLKYKGFKNLLIESSNLSAEEASQTLHQAFEKWKSNYEQIDDVCVLGIYF